MDFYAKYSSSTGPLLSEAGHVMALSSKPFGKLVLRSRIYDSNPISSMLVALKAHANVNNLTHNSLS